MSDSEGSISSLHGSGKSATFDEATEILPIRQNQDGQDKEEFEKLLQSMIVSHSISEEEEQVEEGNTNDKIVGRSNSYRL
jgi:hypothetical protein